MGRGDLIGEERNESACGGFGHLFSGSPGGIGERHHGGKQRGEPSRVVELLKLNALDKL
jgi:hypothetical protein